MSFYLYSIVGIKKDVKNYPDKMERLMIIRWAFLIVFLILHIVYTLHFTFSFKKSILFTQRQKAFHLIMIWLIPFVWVMLLKNFTKDTPGYWQIENKSDPEPGEGYVPPGPVAD